MTRVRAALTHFGISVLVFSLFLSLVFFIWYAWPFNYTQGIAEIVYIMAGVDVVLGPLLTLIVFKTGKKTLKFDLSVIAGVQLIALVAGGWIIYKERPAYIVFDYNRFEVVSISDVDFSKSNIPEQEIGVFEKPKFIYANINNVGKAFSEMLNAGKDMAFMPEYYSDYHDNKLNIIRGTRSAKELPFDAGPIDMIEHINYAPVVGKKKDIIALLDNRTGEVIEYRLVDPWAKK